MIMAESGYRQAPVWIAFAKWSEVPRSPDEPTPNWL